MFLVPAAASATNGYFSNGFGVKSQGLAGAGIAYPQDGLAAATNPAGTAFVGDRVDLGLTWFLPSRGTDITGNLAGANGSYDGDGKKNFFIPEFGYVKQVSPTIALGLAVYGNGGLNTDYNNNPFRAFGSSGAAGINLEQLFVSPSVAFKFNDSHSVGVAANFAYQRFEAKGLGAFDNAFASASPGSVTDRGRDSSTGWGLRVGWTGRVTPDLTLGATWASKVHAGKFDKYKGLFADAGSFDIPANYGVGLAYALTPALTVAADVQEIQYGDVKPVADPLAALLTGNRLGSVNGAGFGWRDITVVKIGVSYDHSRDLTLRAGYSHSDQPIPNAETFFNTLAPGVVQDHLTFGATWKTAGGNGELSVFYAHALRKTVNGTGSIPALFGGGNANIHLDQNILGVAYGWKL